MERIIDGLDHVGIVVPDLGQAALAYEAMGFALSPVSRHAAAKVSGADPTPQGSANRCALFDTGYLELVATIDPSLDAGPFPALLKRYAGIHLVAFRTGDAGLAAKELERRDVALDGVFSLERPVDTPDGERLARFSLVRPRGDVVPEARVFLVRHHTPELLWQPRYMSHPNGVSALTGAVLCVSDPLNSARRLEKLVGVKPVQEADLAFVFRFPQGRVSVMAREPVDSRYPGAQNIEPPFVAAVTFACPDSRRVRDLLTDRRVPHSLVGGVVVVPSSAGFGAVCAFEATGGRAN